jgi:hypothetical protein
MNRLKHLSFIKLILLVAILMLQFSCDQESKRTTKRTSDKEAKVKKIKFEKIKMAWDFYNTPINETAEEATINWRPFKLLLTELGRKPKNSIEAYQRQAIAIGNTAVNLQYRIPETYNIPEIKARINLVATKAKLVDLYLSLDPIQEDKVIQYINETNRDLAALQRDMERIVQKSKIPLEEGEATLIEAIKDSKKSTNSTQPNNQNEAEQ